MLDPMESVRTRSPRSNPTLLSLTWLQARVRFVLASIVCTLALSTSACGPRVGVQSPGARSWQAASSGAASHGAAQSVSPPGSQHLGDAADRAAVDDGRIVSAPDARTDDQQASEPPRYFPFFATEDPWASVSVGTTSDGWLANGVPAPPSAFLSMLPRNYENQLNYGTGEMVDLLLGAAERVSYGFPGTMLFIGHIAARNGGDIDYSVSHNNGRDADIAYFSTNPFGWQ